MAETKVVNIDPQTCHEHLYLVLVGWVPIGRASFQSKEERHFSKFNLLHVFSMFQNQWCQHQNQGTHGVYIEFLWEDLTNNLYNIIISLFPQSPPPIFSFISLGSAGLASWTLPRLLCLLFCFVFLVVTQSLSCL